MNSQWNFQQQTKEIFEKTYEHLRNTYRKACKAFPSAIVAIQMQDLTFGLFTDPSNFLQTHKRYFLLIDMSDDISTTALRNV